MPSGVLPGGIFYLFYLQVIQVKIKQEKRQHLNYYVK